MPDEPAEPNPTQLDRKYAQAIPETLRTDIGAAFSKMLSDDPAYKIPATRSFMALLQTAFVINGDTRYDALINEHTKNSIDAIALYASDNWAAAGELCYKIQADLGFLVYCGYGVSDRSSTSGLLSASITPQKTDGKGGHKQ